MRFQQLMRTSNAILKKKMYKSGKNWIGKSTLSIAGGLALFGVSQVNVVKADNVNNQLANVQGKAQDTVDPSAEKDQEYVSQSAIPDAEQTNTIDEQENKVFYAVPEQPKLNVSDVPSDQAGEQVKTDQGVSANADNIESNKSLGGTTLEDNTGDPDNERITGQESEPTSGEVVGVKWNVSQEPDGLTLTIEPGEMEEIANDSDPWGSAGDYLRENVKQISIDASGLDVGNYTLLTAGRSISGLFQNFINVESISNLKMFSFQNTEDLSNLFKGCSSLKSIDTNDLNLVNVTNFSSMFEGDTSLESLDLSFMKNKKNDNVENMFKEDDNLRDLILSSNTKLDGAGLINRKVNESIGQKGWTLVSQGSDDLQLGTFKSTDDLISLYDGGADENEGTTFEWYSYPPVLIRVVAIDTNGKVLKTLTYYGQVGLKADISSFQKDVNDLNENGTIITDDLRSRVYMNDKDGKSILTDDMPNVKVDDNNTLFIPLTDETLTAINADMANAFKIDGTIVSKEYSGDENIMYFLYPAKEVPSNGTDNSSTNNSSSKINREIEGIEEKISTYAEQPDVQLYDDNGSILTDRKLAPNSDWFTDESMQLNKDKYYRVATNQWAKANDVYLYYPSASKVRVNAGTTATLVTDEGKTVTDRALQPLSNWYTDKYIYINDVKYYRVATNEFVSANQVVEY